MKTAFFYIERKWYQWIVKYTKRCQKDNRWVSSNAYHHQQWFISFLLTLNCYQITWTEKEKYIVESSQWLTQIRVPYYIDKFMLNNEINIKFDFSKYLWETSHQFDTWRNCSFRYYLPVSMPGNPLIKLDSNRHYDMT